MEKQIQITLDILWAIKNENKFYFMEYGKEHLRSLVKNCSIPDVPLSACTFYMAGNDTSGNCNNCGKPQYLH